MTECHPGVTSANFWCQSVGGGWNAWDLAKTLFGVKLHANVPLAGLGCVVPGCSSPGTTGMFSYVQDGNPYFGPCNGDSGGPAFITGNGATYVAGHHWFGVGFGVGFAVIRCQVDPAVGLDPDRDGVVHGGD